MWLTFCNFIKKETRPKIFSRTLLKFSYLLFCKANPWCLLLLLDKNSRYYERWIKQIAPWQFSILINDSDLRETDLHEISKITVPTKQTLVVRRTPCFIWNKFLSPLAFTGFLICFTMIPVQRGLLRGNYWNTLNSFVLIKRLFIWQFLLIFFCPS